MSDRSQKKSTSKKTKNSKQSQGLEQKASGERNKVTKATSDVKKDIEDTINSVGKKMKDARVVQIARKELVTFYKELKKHPRVVMFGVILGCSASFLIHLILALYS